MKLSTVFKGILLSLVIGLASILVTPIGPVLLTRYLLGAYSDFHYQKITGTLLLGFTWHDVRYVINGHHFFAPQWSWQLSARRIFRGELEASHFKVLPLTWHSEQFSQTLNWEGQIVFDWHHNHLKQALITLYPLTASDRPAATVQLQTTPKGWLLKAEATSDFKAKAEIELNGSEIDGQLSILEWYSPESPLQLPWLQKLSGFCTLRGPWDNIRISGEFEGLSTAQALGQKFQVKFFQQYATLQDKVLLEKLQIHFPDSELRADLSGTIESAFSSNRMLHLNIGWSSFGNALWFYNAGQAQIEGTLEEQSWHGRLWSEHLGQKTADSTFKFMVHPRNKLVIEHLDQIIWGGLCSLQGVLQWANGTWSDVQLHAEVRGLDPHTVSSRINGQIDSNLDLHFAKDPINSEIDLHTALNVKGQWNSMPLHGDVQFSLKKNQLQSNNGSLSCGDNNINWDMDLINSDAINWQLKVLDLSVFYPTLNGSINSVGRLFWPFNASQLYNFQTNGHFHLDQFSFSDFKLGKMAVQWNLPSSLNAPLSAQWSVANVQYHQWRIDHTQHTLSGTRNTVNWDSHWWDEKGQLLADTSLFIDWIQEQLRCRALNLWQAHEQYSLSKPLLLDWKQQFQLREPVSWGNRRNRVLFSPVNNPKGWGIEWNGHWWFENMHSWLASNLSWQIHSKLSGKLQGDGNTIHDFENILKVDHGQLTSDGAVFLTESIGPSSACSLKWTPESTVLTTVLSLGQHNTWFSKVLLPHFSLNRQLWQRWPKQNIDAQISFNLLDLRWLNHFCSPHIRLHEGSSQGELDLHGELADLLVRGELGVFDVNGEIPQWGTRWNKVYWFIQSTAPQKLEYKSTGFIGEGAFNFEGSLSGRLQDLKLESHLSGEQLKIMDTPECQATVNADLTWSQANTEEILSGKIEVSDAKIQSFALYSEDLLSLDVSIVPKAAEPRPLRSPVLDIAVLCKQIHYQSPHLLATVVGEVKILKDDPFKPVYLNGELKVTDGHYQAYGKKLALKKGRLFFNRQPFDNPSLDLLATQSVQLPRYSAMSAGDRMSTENSLFVGEVGFTVAGTLRQPIVKLYSRPLLSTENQISYLLFNTSFKEVNLGRDSLLLGILTNLADDHLFKIKNTMKKFFVTDLLITNEATFNTNTGEEYNIQALSVKMTPFKKLSLQYSRGLQDSLQVLRLQYRINPACTLQLTKSSIPSLTGIDLLYQIEKD